MQYIAYPLIYFYFCNRIYLYRYIYFYINTISEYIFNTKVNNI